jgi:hypothetical protein
MQRWGFYSVIDHNNKRKVAADVLLYDKIVVPTPKKDKLGNWDPTDWARWGKWNPQALVDLINQVEDQSKGHVLQAEWDDDRQKDWRKIYEELKLKIDTTNAEREAEFKQLGYWVTRDVLMKGLMKDTLPFHSEGVVEPYAAYQSEDDFFEIHSKKPIAAGISELNCLIAHRLAVPDDQDEDQALQRALKLTTNDTFVKRRQKFYEWQHDLVSLGHAPKDILEELETLVKEYNEVVCEQKGKSRWDTVLTGLAVGGVAVSTAVAAFPGLLAALGLSTLVGLKAVTLATAGNTAAIHIGRRLLGRGKAPDAPQQVAVAGAMFHQIESDIEWKLRIDA